jgi:hypothetical protein
MVRRAFTSEGPRTLIEKDWKPHINESANLQQALANLVRDPASAR